MSWTPDQWKEYQRTGKKPDQETDVKKQKYGNKRTEVDEPSSTRINLKPMSVNDAWKGRRFKSDNYKEYEAIVLRMLPEIDLPKPPYAIHFKFGFSSTASDWDNCIKPTQDVIAKRYNFNDKHIRKGIVETEIVKKGKEYFEFKIENLKSC